MLIVQRYHWWGDHPQSVEKEAIQTRKSPALNSLISCQWNHLFLFLPSLFSGGENVSHWTESWGYWRADETMGWLDACPVEQWLPHVQPQMGDDTYWLSLTHSMRHFTSDSILLRHHNRHNFSQSSLPITISSSNPQSSHPELYVRNSTSLPNSTPLSRLRQLLATQPPGTHPSSFGMCTARNYFTNTLSLRF